MTEIKIQEGKYTVIHDNGTNFHALRNGEKWRDLTGDGLILSMAQHIEQLESRIDWLINEGPRYSKAFATTFSMFSGKGPYITLIPPSLNGLTEILLDKESLFGIIDNAIRDKEDLEALNSVICKKCNTDRTESSRCDYPHECGFKGYAQNSGYSELV